MSLKDKSNAEIRNLLTNYGIMHGPVVKSTRSLYERKLEEAMANDRTFYREEEEEITDITYRQPRRRKTSANLINQRGNSESYEVKQPDQVREINQRNTDDQHKNQPPDQVEVINQRNTDDQHKNQPPDQVEVIPGSRINQSSNAESFHEQQPDQETNFPPSMMDVESSTEPQVEKQQEQVNLASVKMSHRRINHSAVERRPIRGKTERKSWMMIPAVLLLTAVTAGCYYTLSTGM